MDRCVESFHPLEDWNVAEWACAMGGECGEALNVAKKLRRGTMGGGKPVTLQDLADEVADMVIYADLLLASQGLSLEEAIIQKFNRTSSHIGSSILLQEA